MSGDSVNSPSHYNMGKIEVIDAIEDWGLNFPKGNAVKYIARAGHKDKRKEIEDLEKAVWYIKRELKNLYKIEAESNQIQLQLESRSTTPQQPRV